MMRWYSLAFVALVASPAPAQTVRILDSTGDRTFNQLWLAVRAARSGDVLLLSDGFHGDGQVRQRGLNFVGVPGGTATAGLEIKDLTDRNVLIAHLRLAASEEGLAVIDCRRHVRVQNCTIQGNTDPYIWAYAGVRIHNSANVVLKSCEIRGGRGEHEQGYGGPGRAGVHIRGVSIPSFVSLYSCTTKGGNGAEGFPAGDGGDGIWAEERSWVYAPNTTSEGGSGGLCEDGCSPGGNGGSGLLGGSTSVVWFAQTSNSGGPGGWPNGQSGAPVEHEGELHHLPGLPRAFDAQALVHDGAPTPVTVRGEPGDRAYVALASQPHFFFVPSLLGAWLVPMGALMTAIPLGTLPASGTATFDLTLPPVPAHAARERYFTQGFVLTSSGSVALGDPLHFIVLNYDGAPDCNNNGIQDYVDVIEDVFPSGDCNANLIPDDCDIANGTSQDVNGNGIPDECE